MGRDVTAFRERFKAYKNGKSISEIYDAGLPKYANGTPNNIPAYQRFVEEMGPVLFNEMIAQGVKNPKAAYKNMITQLAYESNYGQSRVAREQNNFGGVGWNGKTYTTYKDKADFAKNYVRLMNSRYKDVIGADTLAGYAKGLKNLNYYGDTVENYTRNLVGMKSFAKALNAHMSNNPNLYNQQIPAQEPSPYIAKPVSTAVRPTIPAEQTAPAYDPTISPYISSKPMVKLRPRVQLPNLIEVMEDSEWEPGFPGLKNGKLPEYGDGKLNALIHPIDEVRRRLYDNVFPYAYDNAANRAFSAIFKNRPDESEQFSKVFYQGNQALLDDLWGTYLQIPNNQRHQKRVLTKSKYKPSISNKEDGLYYSAPLDKQELQYIVDSGVLHGRDKDAPKLLNPDFGHYTVSRGYDNKGDYVSYYDSWDLNPFRGITSISNKYANKLGLNKIEDLSFGIGPKLLYKVEIKNTFCNRKNPRMAECTNIKTANLQYTLNQLTVVNLLL